MTNKEIKNHMMTLACKMVELKREGKDLMTLAIGFHSAMKEQKVSLNVRNMMWIEAENAANAVIKING